MSHLQGQTYPLALCMASAATCEGDGCLYSARAGDFGCCHFTLVWSRLRSGCVQSRNAAHALQRCNDHTPCGDPDWESRCSSQAIMRCWFNGPEAADPCSSWHWMVICACKNSNAHQPGAFPVYFETSSIQFLVMNRCYILPDYLVWSPCLACNLSFFLLLPKPWIAQPTHAWTMWCGPRGAVRRTKRKKRTFTS